MKTLLKSRSCQGILLFILLWVNIPSFAQVPLPSEWKTFVSDPVKNILVRDTFLTQTFEGKDTDNWTFSPDTFELFNATLEGIENQTGNYSYKLLPGSELHFATFDPGMYDSVYIKASFAGKGLGLGESLIIETEDLHKGSQKATWATAQKENSKIHYKENTVGDGLVRTNPIQIGGNPTQIHFKVTDKHSSGYFCLDHVFAFTNQLPAYSLFMGKGDWKEKKYWSDLPVYQSRNALIQGEITVNSITNCKEAWLSNSVLTIPEHSRWTCKELNLFDSQIHILEEGELLVENQIHIHKTFDEKGKWYFLSFPFDVYKEGLDRNFELQDEQPNSGGNFLYALTYNGLKRSERNMATGNWEVISIAEENKPIFEKGKGYLVAIDIKATQNVLTFSSDTASKEKEEFKTHTLSIDIPETTSTQDIEHYGWHLCGNPFLSPLSVRQLKNYPELEPYIYFYNGTSYTVLAIADDPVIPPFSSFFIKTIQGINIQLQNILPESIPKETYSQNVSTQSLSEPQHLSTRSMQPEEHFPVCSLNGKQLSIIGMEHTGALSIYDLTGRKLHMYSLSTGDHTIHLSLSRGIYLFQLTSGSYQAQHKFVITQ